MLNIFIPEKSNTNNQKGISVLGLVLALAIFAIISSAIVSLIMGSFVGVIKSEKWLTANALSQQSYEAVRNIRDTAWNDLVYQRSSVDRGPTGWYFTGEGTFDAIDEYTRTIDFYDVCRSVTGNIVNCPGEYTDAHSKKLVVEVIWPTPLHQFQATSSVRYSTFLTNWEGKDWIHTDWSGGNGQYIWSDTTMYQSDDTNFLISNSGQIELYKSTEGGGWIPSGGSHITDTSDAHFNAGIHDNTRAIRTGDASSLALNESYHWAEHPDSASVTTENINSISSINAGSIWAAANNGIIMQYQAGNWTQHTNTGSQNLNAIEMLSPLDGWAVGDSGAIFKYNGSTWSNPINIANVSEDTLADFSAGTHSNTLATSTSGGEIILDQNTAWSESAFSASTTIGTIRASSVLSPNNIWVVGDTGKIIHYNGTTWSQSNDVGTEIIYDIDMVNTADGWAVGASGRFYHWDGVSWYLTQDIGNKKIYSIDMVSPTEGWAAGDSGRFYYYNGVSWSQSQNIGNQHFRDIKIISPTNGWAVADRGVIAHFNGSSWSQFDDTGSQTWHSLGFIAANDIWVSGSDGEIWHFNGASWSPHSDTGSQTWYSIDMQNPSQGFIAGSGGQVKRWNGTGWIDETSVTTEDLYNFIHITNEDLWAFGDNGTIIQFKNYSLPTGDYISQVLDSGAASSIWGTVSWTEDIPIGANIAVSVRAGETPSPNGSWSSWSAELAPSSGAPIPSTAGRYVQYRASLTRATNPTQTPSLENIQLTYNEPPMNNINAFSSVATDDHWVVGDSGYIAHYTPGTLSPLLSPVTEDLNTIDMINSTEGWAAGEGGKVLYYDGLNWAQYTDTGNHAWTTIQMINSSDGWLVGSEGKIYHYNGSSWSEYVDTGSMTWNDLQIVSPTFGLVVGDGGEIYNFDGFSWSATTSPTVSSINAVDATSSTSAWAGGDSGLILNYGLNYFSNGTFLSRVFDGIENDPGWDSVYWQENLSTDSDITISTRTGPTPAPDGSWTSWSAEMTDHALSPIPSNQNDQYLQYRATLTLNSSQTSPELDTISVTYAGATSFILNDISAYDQNNVWAVGDVGKIAFYNGVSWIEHQDMGGGNIHGVDAIAANNAWAVGGGGKVFHYNGLSWTEFDDTGGHTWYDIDMLSASDGWMVGNSGKIWHYDGVSWTQTIDMGNRNVYSIDMISATEGWAGADNDEIYYYNGITWTEIIDTGSTDWLGVHMLNSNYGWMVGSGGDIRQYDGASWNVVPSTVNNNLNAVYVFDTDDAIAVGDDGVIIYWDGLLWSEVTNPNNYDLHGIDMINNTTGWVVGFKGVVSMLREGVDIVPPSGVLISSAFNMGTGEYPVETIEWDQEIPTDCAPITACTIKFEVRTAPDFFGTPAAWTSWYGANGPGTYLEEYRGTVIPADLNWNSWVQYRLTMTSDNTVSPILKEVRINYEE